MAIKVPLTPRGIPRLGCQVTLLHKYDRLMNKDDTDAAELIQKTFQEEGIRPLLNARPLWLLGKNLAQ